MQFGWNFLFSRFCQVKKKKNLIWDFNCNFMILIWVYLDTIVRPPQLKILGSATVSMGENCLLYYCKYVKILILFFLGLCYFLELKLNLYKHFVWLDHSLEWSLQIISLTLSINNEFRQHSSNILRSSDRLILNLYLTNPWTPY